MEEKNLSRSLYGTKHEEGREWVLYDFMGWGEDGKLHEIKFFYLTCQGESFAPQLRCTPFNFKGQK